MLSYLHEPPQQFGGAGGRWSLALCQQLIPAFTALSLSGVKRRFVRWKIAWKVGRLHITSPDPRYQEKLAAIQQAYEETKADPTHRRFLYADEFTYYRQPPLGRTYHEQGNTHEQPTALWPGGTKTKRRIAGAMDALSGEVYATTAAVMGKAGLCRFLSQVRQTVDERYGRDVQVWLAWDNWRAHSSAEVVEAAEEYGIQLLYLPTYAPWTNPIEKLWKKLKDEVLRFHRKTEKDTWPDLWQSVASFLQKFATPSPELLRYVGLQNSG